MLPIQSFLLVSITAKTLETHFRSRSQGLWEPRAAGHLRDGTSRAAPPAFTSRTSSCRRDEEVTKAEALHHSL